MFRTFVIMLQFVFQILACSKINMFVMSVCSKKFCRCLLYRYIPRQYIYIYVCMFERYTLSCSDPRYRYRTHNLRTGCKNINRMNNTTVLEEYGRYRGLQIATRENTPKKEHVQTSLQFYPIHRMVISCYIVLYICICICICYSIF